MRNGQMLELSGSPQQPYNTQKSQGVVCLSAMASQSQVTGIDYLKQRDQILSMVVPKESSTRLQTTILAHSNHQLVEASQ